MSTWLMALVWTTTGPLGRHSRVRGIRSLMTTKRPSFSTRIRVAYTRCVGTYVGSAILLDDDEAEITAAQVSLATIDVVNGTWQGYAHGIDASALDGQEITVSLPTGTKS